MSEYPDNEFPWTFFFNGVALPKWGACWGMADICSFIDLKDTWDWDVGPRDISILNCRIDHVGVVESADPDIFRYAYSSASFPPKGGNRGRYANPRVDALLKAAAAESDQAVRKADYVEVQKILAEELPGIPLWYPNNEVVHTRRVEGVRPRGSGSFDFLREAWVR